MAKQDANTPQTIPERYYKVASDTLRAGMLGQAGAVTDHDSLDKELIAYRDNVIPNWSAFDSPYVLKSPDAEAVENIRLAALDIWDSWDDAGRPPIQ